MSQRDVMDDCSKLDLLRQELAEVSSGEGASLGPPEFLRRYVDDLKRRIEQLQQEHANG